MDITVTEHGNIRVQDRIFGADTITSRPLLGIKPWGLRPTEIDIFYIKSNSGAWELLDVAVYGRDTKTDLPIVETWFPDCLSEAPSWVQKYVADHVPSSDVTTVPQIPPGVPMMNF